MIVKFSGMHAPPDAPMPTVTHTAQTRIDHQFNHLIGYNYVKNDNDDFFLCIKKQKNSHILRLLFFF